MIRMGRSSKTERSSEPSYQTQPTNSAPTYPYSGGNIAPSNHAVTESESIARDIKEGRLSGFVGSGTVLTGETTFQAMLRVDGHLTGRVTSENGTLIVGSTGQVDADITVAAAVINGAVNGDIITSERLELGRTARVSGNIQSPRLIIADGAIFEGNCSMLKAKESLEKRNAEADAQFADDLSPFGADTDAEETNGYYETSDEDEETVRAAA
jgi:cytoskeletal protein CcmA (bactofilin family)